MVEATQQAKHRLHHHLLLLQLSKKIPSKLFTNLQAKARTSFANLREMRLLKFYRKRIMVCSCHSPNYVSYTNNPARLVARQKARWLLSRLGPFCLPHRRHPQTNPSAGSTSACRPRRSHTASLLCIRQWHQRDRLPRSCRKSKTNASCAAQTTWRRQETSTATCTQR